MIHCGMCIRIRGFVKVNVINDLDFTGNKFVPLTRMRKIFLTLFAMVIPFSIFSVKPVIGIYILTTESLQKIFEK